MLFDPHFDARVQSGPEDSPRLFGLGRFKIDGRLLGPTLDKQDKVAGLLVVRSDRLVLLHELVEVSDGQVAQLQHKLAGLLRVLLSILWAVLEL